MFSSIKHAVKWADYRGQRDKLVSPMGKLLKSEVTGTYTSEELDDMATTITSTIHGIPDGDLFIAVYGAKSPMRYVTAASKLTSIATLEDTNPLILRALAVAAMDKMRAEFKRERYPLARVANMMCMKRDNFVKGGWADKFAEVCGTLSELLDRVERNAELMLEIEEWERA